MSFGLLGDSFPFFPASSMLFSNDKFSRLLERHVPPMLIFPRVHFKNHMLTGVPTASIGDTNPTGWLNERPFVDCLKSFIVSERSHKEDTVDFRQS